MRRYSLPLLDQHGKRSVKSVYTVHSSSLLMTMYTTWRVLIFRVSEIEKLSSSSSCRKISWKDWQGFFLALSLINHAFITPISAGLSGHFLVLCKFGLSWFKQPCIVATEVGRCFNNPCVKPGYVLKWVFLYICFKCRFHRRQTRRI